MLNASKESYKILLARRIRDQNERHPKSEFFIEFFLHIQPSTAILQRLRNAAEAVSMQAALMMLDRGGVASGQGMTLITLSVSC